MIYCRYDIMLACWESDPSARPSFSQISHQIGNIMEIEGVSDRPRFLTHVTKHGLKQKNMHLFIFSLKVEIDYFDYKFFIAD